MLYKEDWKSAKEHFEAFWNLDYLNRCNLAISVGKKEGQAMQRVERGYTVKDSYVNPDCIHWNMENHCRNTDFLYESIPAHYLNFGTGGHCAYFGCRPVYAPETIWFDPILPEPDGALLQFGEAGRQELEEHKQIAAKLAALSQGRYLTAMPDNCGIIDCLAEMRGTQELLVDMLEEPEFVHDAINRIIPVWKETEREFLDLLRGNNEGGSSHGWMQLWCPGSHVQIQCDYSVMISPAMFEEFVLPELEQTAGVFDYTTYHLDGLEQLRHLDMILSVKGITNIQWTPVDGQPRTSASIEALQRIQRAGKGLVLIPQAGEVEFLLKNLSHKGLHMIVQGVENRDDAEAMEKMARQLAHD